MTATHIDWQARAEAAEAELANLKSNIAAGTRELRLSDQKPLTRTGESMKCKFDILSSNHQLNVAEFMRKAGQNVPDVIGLPDAETRLLRAKLIMEEAMETVKALGLDVYIGSEPFPIDTDSHPFLFVDNDQPDLTEVIDGCCDMSVVLQGTLLACGVPDKPFLHIVDESNLAKFGEGGHRRGDGKWIKPPDWKAPDIAGLVETLNDQYKVPAKDGVGA